MTDVWPELEEKEGSCRIFPRGPFLAKLHDSVLNAEKSLLSLINLFCLHSIIMILILFRIFEDNNSAVTIQVSCDHQ